MIERVAVDGMRKMLLYFVLLCENDNGFTAAEQLSSLYNTSQPCFELSRPE